MHSSGDHTYLHSFPTRRSSDLNIARQSMASRYWHTKLIKDLRAMLSTPPASAANAWSAKFPLDSFAIYPAKLLCRSEEHTSELQSRVDLVCRLLLEKKKKKKKK